MNDETLTAAEQELLDRATAEAEGVFAEFDQTQAGDDALLDRLVDAGMEVAPTAAPAAASSGLGKVAAGAALLGAGVLAWVLSGDEGPAGASSPSLEPQTTISVDVHAGKPTANVRARPIAPAPKTNEGEGRAPEAVPEEPADEPAEREAKALSAEQMLIRADAARRDQQHRAARDRYGALIRTYPKTREASIGRVSLGKLELEKLKSPRRALKQFDAYLRENPKGNLAEEVMWLRARSWRSLDDPNQERAALKKLLARYPGTTRAPQAKSRLEQLGG